MTNPFISKLKEIPKHSLLLLGIILFVFVFPLFEKSVMKGFFISLSYSLMILSVSSIVEFKKKWIYYLIIIAVAFQWVNFFTDLSNYPIFNFASFGFSVIVFSIAIYLMIKQIIASKRVDAGLIIETIIGYLLIGIVFTLINVLQTSYNPSSIGFGTDSPRLGEIIYYSYVTFTTIGYGDISPVTQSARGFAILFGLIGQLYLTIIIAFIIGKYLNAKK